MNQDDFVYKIHCELSITSESVSSVEITNELNIVPQRQFNKGDEFTSKHTQRIGKRLQHLWAVKSKSTLSNDESVSAHIEYIGSLIKGKEEILRKYKKESGIEVSVWIWIKTDNAGIGFELSEKELFFLNDIANRIHFSVLTNTSIAS